MAADVREFRASCAYAAASDILSQEEIMRLEKRLT